MIAEDLRLFLQGNSLSINFAKFYMAENVVSWPIIPEGYFIEVQIQVLYCRKSLSTKEEPSSITYCLLSRDKFQVWKCEAMCHWEGSFKMGSLYCQTRGQYDQMSQNVPWRVFSGFHPLQGDRGLPGSSQGLLGKCTEPVKTCWSSAVFCACVIHGWVLGCVKTIFAFVWHVGLGLAKVTGWHCVPVCPSIMFSVVCFVQHKIGLAFWLDFDLEEVTPATMGWVQHGCCTQHVTTRPARFSGGQCWVQRSSVLFSCAWCWHSVN